MTVSEFKEHCQTVLCKRYEVDPGVIKGVVAGVSDLRGTTEAGLGNDSMEARIEREEFEYAIREIWGSAPGKDGVRIGYIGYASEKVRGRVIGFGLVQRMFEGGTGGMGGESLEADYNTVFKRRG